MAAGKLEVAPGEFPPWLQERDGKLVCARCDVCVVATGKGIKQHLKSKSHKLLPKGAPEQPGGASAPEANGPRARSRASARGARALSDDDETLQELARLLGAGEAELGAGARARLPEYAAALDAFRAVAPCARACLLPPLLRNPRRECPALDRPFVTAQVGSIPELPESLDDALRAYFSGVRGRHPKVDVCERAVAVHSWADARRALEAADAAGSRYWCTLFCAEMGHPPWWPRDAKGPRGVGEGATSVPFFDQIILGRGAVGIGLHADTYAPHAAPVSTCLTLLRGRKRVLMLPPSTGDGRSTCHWLVGEPFPHDPPAALLARIASVGGYWFELQVAPGADPLAFFTPAGWFHWLVGDTCHAPDCAPDGCAPGCSDWHVAFGGSFFPRAALARGHALPARRAAEPEQCQRDRYADVGGGAAPSANACAGCADAGDGEEDEGCRRSESDAGGSAASGVTQALVLE